jgi:hypothetical protein
MTDSRWLNELSKTYIAESVETPMSLMEQQLQEHAEYISTLETMLALVVEEFDIDVDSLVEAAKKPMPKKASAQIGPSDTRTLLLGTTTLKSLQESPVPKKDWRYFRMECSSLQWK